LEKFPKAKLVLFMYSFGVAAGRPMMTAKQRLITGSIHTFEEVGNVTQLPWGRLDDWQDASKHMAVERPPDTRTETLTRN
jgi:hypothetical protein